MSYDVIVAGAGASGLFASILLGRAGLSVLVIEQNPKVGQKLALCGGGSCNVGPRERTPEDLAPRYRHFTPDKNTPAQVYKPLHKLKTLFFDLTPALVLRVFSSEGPVELPALDKGSSPVVVEGLGIPCRVGEGGRLFPQSLDAPGLSERLYALARASGVEFRLAEKVTDLSWEGTWTLETQRKASYSSPQLFLATGGSAYPAVGGSGEGALWLSALGIPTVEARPSMGSLALSPHPFQSLSGLSLLVRVTLRAGGRNLLRSPLDTLLLTHKGLSGPAILDLCGLVHKNQDGGPSLELDFLPETEASELADAWDRRCRDHPKKQVSNFLGLWIPHALGLCLLDKLEIPQDKPVGTLNKSSLQKIQKTLKSWEVFPSLPTPWNQAMSWTGGCEPGAVQERTMEVRGQRGLFVLGDMVSLDRPCGGYSLFFAWTSALAACRKVLTRASPD